MNRSTLSPYYFILVAFFALSTSCVQAQTTLSDEKPVSESITEAPETVNLPVDYQSYFRVTAENKVEFHLQKDSSQTMRLSIKDEEGNVIHSQRFGQKVGKFQKAFRMDRFPKGDYQFELERGGEVITSKTINTSAP